MGVLDYKGNNCCPNGVWKTFCKYLNTVKFNHKMFFFDTNYYYSVIFIFSDFALATAFFL